MCARFEVGCPASIKHCLVANPEGEQVYGKNVRVHADISSSLFACITVCK